MHATRLQAVGDVTLHTADGSDPFALVAGVLDRDAVLFANLETALSEQEDGIEEKAYAFCSSPSSARHLAGAGFDVVSTANNHILDAGAGSLAGTLAALDEHGIAAVGAELRASPPAPTVIRRQGLALGFLAYTEGGRDESGVFIRGIDAESIAAEIGTLRQLCDVVVVSLHWGVEQVFYPSPEQIAVARSLVDAGARIVLGHHPHVVQGIERYGDGLIAYSLGNFQFATKRREFRQSIVLSVTIEKDRVAGYDLVPVAINRHGQPVPMEEEGAREMRRFVDDLSRVVRTNTITSSWWFEQIAYTYLKDNMESWWIRIRRYGARHALHCLRWLVSPFVLRCYLGIARRAFRRHE